MTLCEGIGCNAMWGVEGIKIVHNFGVSDRWYVKSSIKSVHKYIETSKVILIVIHFFGQSKEKFTQIKVF